MVRAKDWFLRPLSALLITLIGLFSIGCDQPPDTSEAVAALSRSNGQLQVDQCMTQNTTDAARKQCIGAAGFSLFDDTGIETADACIPNCICVNQENCPCCDYGEFFTWVFWPRPGPGVWTPSAPMSETVAIDIDRACVGTPQDRKAPLTLHTRSASRLASLVDLEVSLPKSGIVAATVSDDGRHHDPTRGDKQLSGLALTAASPTVGCAEFECHFECEGDWVYPTPEEGWCPAHNWFGIGCLKLTSCSFGCGGSTENVGVRPAENIFTLR